MHERKGIKAPSGPTLSLNNAVDNLYKNEFDIYIEKKRSHIRYNAKMIFELYTI